MQSLLRSGEDENVNVDVSFLMIQLFLTRMHCTIVLLSAGGETGPHTHAPLEPCAKLSDHLAQGRQIDRYLSADRRWWNKGDVLVH